MTVTACLVAWCIGSTLEFTTEDPDAALAGRVDAYAQPLVDAGQLSGTLLIACDDVIVLERAWGLANHEHGVPNTMDTRFSVASITKPMTLVLALQLLEAQTLRLDATVADFLEDFPRGEEITVNHLINHRSGLPHRITTDENEASPRTAADMVELARHATLLSDPGKRNEYSSLGFSVLARILELADGHSYEEMLRTRLFEPAGMTASAHLDARTLLPHRASSYVFGATGLLNTAPKDYSFLVGAGSVWSTARDLHRMSVAVRSGKLGRSVQASLAASGNVHWNGVTNGYFSYLDYDATAKFEIVFLGNVHTGAISELQRDALRLAKGEAVASPSVPQPALIALTHDQLARWEGIYERSPGSAMPICVRGGFLMAGDRPLLPVSDAKFYSPCDWGYVEPKLAADGSINGLEWTYPGGRLSFERIADLGEEEGS